ncbi:hypothetical protein ALQ04_02108 [Pseudomonas cichorii]|uniref:Uncharacterized protein n=1 Tax=Pseudomonas cichorii TaxID=36746 RepID=A0A3M4M065_PSECI|nr:beta-galactosidase [Pseudomonas cichorii]RMQ46691.1 hypothetical protein ALQ04_02108 [Pseudomonas cichorii]
MSEPENFASFLMGGFECTSSRRGDGRRLDLIAATGHERWAERDYRRLAGYGLRTVRDGVRWHLIEPHAGYYDFSSLERLLLAAARTETQVIWDLGHYGYPDDLDIWRPVFVERFARMAQAVARRVRESSDAVPYYCPINEPSFWAWGGGEVGYFYPLGHKRGTELKHQLVRASIEAMAAIREVDPRARFIHADPLIHVRAMGRRPGDIQAAEAYRLAQYESWDMLCGRSWPGLGGQEDFLDILGVNFYPHNQWYFGGPTILLGEPDFRPLAGMLVEVYVRYGRPLLISETGAEGSARGPWLDYVGEQAILALNKGVDLRGLCLYPVLDYPGWDDDRHCTSGLLGYADAHGVRPEDPPTREALARIASRLPDPRVHTLKRPRT